MPIRITIDELLTRRKLRARQLAEMIGVSETHLSLFRTGKVRGVRFGTLSKICAALQCQPGELLIYEEGEETEEGVEEPRNAGGAVKEEAP